MEGDLAKTRCMFTLKLPVPILNDRKTDLKRTLEAEQQELENRTDLEDIEERAQSLDLLTWVEFKLGNPETAMEVNDKALLISQEKREVTLANRAHLFFNRGDLSHAREILDEIAGLPRTAVSEATAIAQQAYCFFRFGGPNNLGEAIKLYEQALEKYSGIYLWSLQLGIVYRRASHPNMIREVDHRDEVRTRMTRYKPRAAELYDHVIMNSSSRRIKAIAYSEKAFMSSMERQDLNRVESMCRMALELVVNEDPFVLTLCGKALLKVNKLWAQELLERATQAGESSHAFHTLGNCWKSIAKDRRLSGGRCFNDQMEHCFKQAVRLGSDNVPAKLSWAKLLQEKGLMEEAFEKFKDVIISVGNGDNLYTLASTYESAALCMIQYCNGQEVMDSPRGRSIMKEAEQMCIKALALEFKMLRVRELRGRTALECLRTIAESRRNPEASFRLSKLLGIIDDPDIDFQELGMIVKAIDKINMGHVISTLKSYHQNGCLEAAYTLLEVSTVWRGADTVGEDIALELKLGVAKQRLLQASLEAVRIFSELFEKHWQTHGQTHSRCGDAGSRPMIRFSEDAAKPSSNNLDVLIVCDETNSDLSSTWQLLQTAMRNVFGLTVSLNQRHCATAIPNKNLQLEEMVKAKVVLVLLSGSTEDSYFGTVLQGIPSITMKGEHNQRPPYITLGIIDANTDVPAHLSGFPQKSLILVTEALSHFESFIVDHTADCFTVGDEHHRSTEMIISFFCFLAGIQRPSPVDGSV